jgi:hypothetical protein
MEYLDNEEGIIDCGKMIDRADNEIKAGGITGYMAGCVVTMISQCHSKGEEFRKKWNQENGEVGFKGVVNPAIFFIQKWKEGER